MVSEYFQLRAILADPDLSTRMRLRQATTAVPKFGDVLQVNTLSEAASRLDGESRVDLIFLSYRYSLDEVKKFVEEARKTKQGDTAAYILVLRSRDQDNSTVASTMMMGIDGFLFEPYSVDSLTEMVDLATRVRKEREEVKEKMAATLLTSDIISQLDLIAYLKAQGYSMHASWNKFVELCKRLREVTHDTSTPTFDTFAQLFTEAPLPKKVFETKSYGGVSRRVRKRMEDKVLRQFDTFGGKDGRILHK